jgi:acyl transferase domain-containing protein
VVTHLLATEPAACRRLAGVTPGEEVEVPRLSQPRLDPPRRTPRSTPGPRRVPPAIREEPAMTAAGAAEAIDRPIAIVSMSARLPQASDLAEIWDNLRAGRDCVTEVPAARWDHRRYFDAAKGAAGKTYSRWGGFLDGIDAFDPLFFNIAPREAAQLDPRQRLFLEVVWDLLERVGYTRQRLRGHYQGRVGVYVGAGDVSGDSAPGVFASGGAIANRVSYFFGLSGPSLAIDTMCSSSMIAIHLACRALVHGECALAIAGGINLAISPEKYISLSQRRLLSSRPDRRGFADSDGFLPAEAVGAVLLKPLRQAMVDGDRVLAVIKGTASNQNGQSSGFAAPNLAAITQLVEDNLAFAGVEPQTISYVEAAASGAPLADAVEVAALSRVFKRSTADQPPCAIGSVKSTIGHAEAASGVTQLIKVVLQLQHAQIAPTIYTEPLNPDIRFEDTPFQLQRTLTPWTRPRLQIGGDTREQPRRALITSFGAGGSNASLIVEEAPAAGATTAAADDGAGPEVLVFSARNADRLTAVVRHVLERLDDEERLSLSDLAYTLQCGREAMPSRLAIVASDRRELIEAMQGYLGERDAPGSVYVGTVTHDRSTIRELGAGAAGEAVVRLLVAQRDLRKLALMWTYGVEVPWEQLHQGRQPSMVPLPTYPFERVSSGAAAPVPIEASPDQTDAPRTELERTIAQIWEEVLGLSGVGLHDTFIELGGNSLASLRVLEQLREHFQVDVPVRLLLGPDATIPAVAVAVVSQLVQAGGMAHG